MGVAGLPVGAGSSTSRSSVAPAGAGWSGRRGGWWAGGEGVQGLPAVGPGPMDRQVQVESAGGGSEPAGDSDDPAAQGGPSGLGQVAATAAARAMLNAITARETQAALAA